MQVVSTKTKVLREYLIDMYVVYFLYKQNFSFMYIKEAKRQAITNKNIGLTGFEPQE